MAEDVFGIVGSVIAGAYQVEAVVAEGGFGVVYRAHHVGFRAPIALKCLKVPQGLGAAHEAEFLEQFRAEAELLFRLSASIPTVVRPLHVDALTAPDGRFVPFMALEWLQGETLDEIVRRRVAAGRPGMSLKKLVRLLTPVARALERAHNFAGPEGPISIVHRDLKPENIFVADVAGEQIVKVLDFGIAKAKSVASQVVGRASQNQSALTAFTPAYGAPEQWLPKRYGQTGPWTDVWGLALTMVEVLAQRNIIDGDVAAMMGAAVDPERRPTPRTEGVNIPDAAEQVFLRALAVDPKERYRDAGELWSALCSAVGVRADEERMSSVPPRDARAEPGLVPRVETVEAAQRVPASSGFRSRTAAGSQVETQPAVAVAGASEVWPTAPKPAMPTPAAAAAPAPELGAIPDLAPAPIPARPSTRPSAARAGFSRELDLDLSSTEGIDLALDVGGDAELARRVSRPDMPAVGSSPSWPAPEAPTSARTSSGEHPAVGRTVSGGYPAVSPSAPAPPQSVPPVSARTASGAHHPAVGSASVSGTHPALGPVSVPSPAPTAEPGIMRRLLPGIVMVVLSIIVTLVDQAYAAASGEVFALGPVRTTWIAGVVMIAGVSLIIHRLIQHQKH